MQCSVEGEAAEVQAVLAQQVVLHQVVAVHLDLQRDGEILQHHQEDVLPHGVELLHHRPGLVHQLAPHHELDEGIGGSVLLPGWKVVAGLELHKQIVPETLRLVRRQLRETVGVHQCGGYFLTVGPD